MKKILFAIFASVTAVLGLLGTSLLTNNVSAIDPGKTSGTAKTAQSNSFCGQSTFYGITRWCEGLSENPDFTKGRGEIAEYILIIVGNIYGMISDIAGYGAVILVMYGGFLYITSSGDPGKSMKGQKTIVNTLIGIVIVKGSDIVIKFVKSIAKNADDPTSSKVSDLASYVGGKALFWGTVIAVLMVVWGALQYSMSAGDPGKATKGKKTIISACIGIGIMLLAAVIVMLVINTLGVNR